MGATPGHAVAVIGAGIAGPAAAHDLPPAGLTPTVFERRDRNGGRSWSVRAGDLPVDLGAAVYLGTASQPLRAATGTSPGVPAGAR